MKLALLLLPIVILSAACAGRSLVGEWDAEGAGMAGITFSADNTFSATLAQGPVSAAMSGSYSTESNRITLNPQSIDLQGLEHTGMSAKIESELKKPMTLTVEWRSNNEVDLIPDEGPALKLRRRK
jgi:hypothetical protein